jgi:hypothetical protein
VPVPDTQQRSAAKHPPLPRQQSPLSSNRIFSGKHTPTLFARNQQPAFAFSLHSSTTFSRPIGSFPSQAESKDTTPRLPFSAKRLPFW